jgi:hypothetical protein
MPLKCPICFNYVTDRGRKGSGGTDPEGDPLPFWTEDSLLTPGGLAGEDFKGLNPRRVIHLQELQDYYTDLGTQLGLSFSFTIIEMGLGISRYHIYELRKAIEDILTLNDLTIADYFQFDRKGNPTITSQTDWTDIDRSNGFPELPISCSVRAIHIEELRRGIVGYWAEFWNNNIDESTYSKGLSKSAPPSGGDSDHDILNLGNIDETHDWEIGLLDNSQSVYAYDMQRGGPGPIVTAITSINSSFEIIDSKIKINSITMGHIYTSTGVYPAWSSAVSSVFLDLETIDINYKVVDILTLKTDGILYHLVSGNANWTDYRCYVLLNLHIKEYFLGTFIKEFDIKYSTSVLPWWHTPPPPVIVTPWYSTERNLYIDTIYFANIFGTFDPTHDYVIKRVGLQYNNVVEESTAISGPDTPLTTSTLNLALDLIKIYSKPV